MKKLLTLTVCAAMLLGLLAGCGASLTPVAGLSEEQAALLEECGIPVEQFNLMSPEEQQAILHELGIVAGSQTQPQEQIPQETRKKYTTSDVANGGKYRVRVGDELLNNYYLYYEDGKLVKVEISFQKSFDEEPDTYTFEGDTLEDFWYYGKSLDELIDHFDQLDYGYTHSVTPID